MLAKDVNLIATTEKLTVDVLFREVLSEAEDTQYSRSKKEVLTTDVSCIASRYGLAEPVVIYCFIRLWQEGKAKTYDFWQSFNKNRLDVASYIKFYLDNISYAQNELWQE